MGVWARLDLDDTAGIGVGEMNKKHKDLIWDLLVFVAHVFAYYTIFKSILIYMRG